MVSWRAVPEVPRYQVSNKGGVFDLHKSRTVGQSPDHDGYLTVRLNLPGGRRRKYFVHKLVLLAFRGLPPLGRPETRHLDGNQLNNRLGNLKYGTRADNIRDRNLHGRTAKGERVPTSVMTTESVARARDMFSQGGWTYKGLAKVFGLGEFAMREIILRKSWRHVE